MVLVQSIRMEEERIEVLKFWPKLQSVRNIQIFLGFAIFYKKLIRNVNRIIVLVFTSIIQTTNDNDLSIQASENKTNYNILSTADSVDGSTGGEGINGNTENLSTITNLAKKSGLIKAKKPDFVIANCSATDFLTLKTKKVFTHLQKAFIKALIL